MDNQGADVQEHFLGRLLFSEVDVSPFGYEFLGIHVLLPRLYLVRLEALPPAAPRKKEIFRRLWMMLTNRR